MAYARHYTLKRMARDVGWGFITTTHYGKTEKAHLLQMRAKPEFYVTERGITERLLNKYYVRPYGAEKLANWYTITFAGMNKLLELWPQEEWLHEMARKAIRLAFTSQDDSLEQYELKLRSPKDKA